MELTFDELILGYKRSLRIIKAIDKKSYKQLLAFFKSMKKQDLKDFFVALKENVETVSKKLACSYCLNYQISNSDSAFISYDNNYKLVIRYNVNPYLSDKWILFRISPLTKAQSVFFEKDDSCNMIHNNFKYVYFLDRFGDKGFVKILKFEKPFKEKKLKEIKEKKKQELDKYCRV